MNANSDCWWKSSFKVLVEALHGALRGNVGFEDILIYSFHGFH